MIGWRLFSLQIHLKMRVCFLKFSGPASENTKQLEIDILHQNATAPSKLKSVVEKLTTAYKKTITERLLTEGIFKQCYQVIASGNKNFSDVYAAVWNLIEVADTDGIKKYVQAIKRVKSEIRKLSCSHLL